MKRYSFRLERFLKLKRYVEREWEQRLAHISGICLEIENRIAYMGGEINRVMLEENPGGNTEIEEIDINELISREMYIYRLNSKISELQDELAKRREELQEVREKYLAASRERKVLEKLKEKKETEYYRLQKLDEIKTIDDLNNAKWAVISSK